MPSVRPFSSRNETSSTAVKASRENGPAPVRKVRDALRISSSGVFTPRSPLRPLGRRAPCGSLQSPPKGADCDKERWRKRTGQQSDSPPAVPSQAGFVRVSGPGPPCEPCTAGVARKQTACIGMARALEDPVDRPLFDNRARVHHVHCDRKGRPRRRGRG